METPSDALGQPVRDAHVRSVAGACCFSLRSPDEDPLVSSLIVAVQHIPRLRRKLIAAGASGFGIHRVGVVVVGQEGPEGTAAARM